MSDSSAPNVSSRRWTRAYSAFTFAAASGSSQKPRSPIRASSAAARSRSPAGSKIVREQGHLLADGGEALRGGEGLRARHRALSAIRRDPGLSGPPACSIPVAHGARRTSRGRRSGTDWSPRSDFDGLVCAALLEAARHARRHPVRPSEGHAGRQGRADRPRHHDEPPLRAGRPSRVRPPRLRARAGRRDRREPRDQRRRPTSAARVVYDHFGGAERFPGVSDGADGARSTRPTAAQFLRGRDPRARRLDLPLLPDGPAHRAWAASATSASPTTS